MESCYSRARSATRHLAYGHSCRHFEAFELTISVHATSSRNLAFSVPRPQRRIVTFSFRSRSLRRRAFQVLISKAKRAGVPHKFVGASNAKNACKTVCSSDRMMELDKPCRGWLTSVKLILLLGTLLIFNGCATGMFGPEAQQRAQRSLEYSREQFAQAKADFAQAGQDLGQAVATYAQGYS